MFVPFPWIRVLAPPWPSVLVLLFYWQRYESLHVDPCGLTQRTEYSRGGHPQSPHPPPQKSSLPVAVRRAASWLCIRSCWCWCALISWNDGHELHVFSFTSNVFLCMYKVLISGHPLLNHITSCLMTFGPHQVPWMLYSPLSETTLRLLMPVSERVVKWKTSQWEKIGTSLSHYLHHSWEVSWNHLSIPHSFDLWPKS